MRRSITARLLAAASLIAATPALGQQMPWRDASKPMAARVDALIAAMTPEEKASQLTNQARAIPRLGVPAYNWWSEALHGVARNGYATVFPQPIGLAATFDPAAVKQMGAAIGTEVRAKFNAIERAGGEHRIYQGLDVWSPNINIFRDPRWGRGQETYGEDPVLTGRMGTAFVEGMQGDDPRYVRVMATAKHFAVHSGPEPTRHSVDVPVSRHDLEDTYLPAFRQLVVDGHVGSLMCAYNRVDGQPACASDLLLTETLRNSWRFTGYVVSDCDAIADIWRGHKYTKSLAEAAAVSLKHGVDNDCTEYSLPPGSKDYQRYLDAMNEGLLSQADVDASLRRLFTARMRLGLFDPPERVPYTRIGDDAVASAEHVALARTLAEKSMVLLKNNGVLPVRPDVKHILVVGPLADQVEVLLGNYNGDPIRPVTALDGIRAAFPDAAVTFEPGTDFLRHAIAVPASALGGDVTAEYWDNAGFSGQPAVRVTAPTVSYDRSVQAPIKGNAISARWTGTLTPTDTGEYELGISGGRAHLWVDGQPVASSVGEKRDAVLTPIHLEAGRHYAIKVEQVPLLYGDIGFVWRRTIDKPLERAVAAAKDADLVIAVAGISSALEGEEMKVDVPGFEGGDRTSLDMPAPEQALLEAVKATGKPLALVLMNGSALSVNWAAKNADAILEAWYPGEQGGTAIGETLAGRNNPSGRLPVTFYTGVAELPAFGDYAMANRTYRYFKGRPLFPFGHGLSYTNFRYGTPVLSAATLKAGTTLGVDAEVTNTGGRDGDEVAQLYLEFPRAAGAPLRALRGFDRVALKPGETKRVHFDLDSRALSMVSADGKRLVAPGAYRVTVGGGQPGTGAPGASASLEISGSAPLPD